MKMPWLRDLFFLVVLIYDKKFKTKRPQNKIIHK